MILLTPDVVMNPQQRSKFKRQKKTLKLTFPSKVYLSIYAKNPKLDKKFTLTADFFIIIVHVNLGI